MTDSVSNDRNPTPDVAEDNAFFPSPYSLSQYTSSKTDFAGASYPNAYRGGKWKVLMIASQERYLLMQNGKFFSTGNHPVEMLLPMYHLDLAGFEIDIATPSGDPVKLEMWAFPQEDEAVKATYEKYRSQLKQPKKLTEVVKDLDGGNYLGVFIPGGHGVLNDIPFSEEVKKTLHWAHDNDRYVISLCHGPAACWRRASASAKRISSIAAMRCACSRTRSIPAPTSTSATSPARCPGWWASACASGRQDRQRRHHRQGA